MRLIDADRLENVFNIWLKEALFCAPDDNTEGAAIFSCLCQLQDAPTIDPEELRTRGHWIDRSPEAPQWAKSFKCSNCGGFVDDDRFNFCPRCGARMEDNDETD